jgi:hypothetical protein
MIEILSEFTIPDALFRTVEQEFQLLLADCRLVLGRSSPGLAGLPAVAGCYLWIATHESARFSIYIGRTNSIRRRAADYSAPFQMHSPNDSKLRFFEEELRAALPAATLSLYFQAIPVEGCAKREQELIAALRPAINTLPVPDEHVRKAIADVYREHYRKALLRRTTRDT